jgi:hypothetical protein
MTLENDLLSIERTLWAAEAEAYRRNLDDRCLIAFTQMAGVSSREEIAGSVEGSQRWSDLDLEVVGLLQPTPDVALLTYRASGSRGDESYRALVSSGYARRDDGWKMVFHQQTPLGD